MLRQRSSRDTVVKVCDFRSASNLITPNAKNICFTKANVCKRAYPGVARGQCSPADTVRSYQEYCRTKAAYASPAPCELFETKPAHTTHKCNGSNEYRRKGK